MSAIILPRGRIAKPSPNLVIDFGNPLTNGMVGAWLFGEGGGGFVQDYSRNACRGTMTGTGPFWAAGRYGPAFNGNGTSRYVHLARAPFTGTTPFSIFAGCSATNIGTRQSIVAWSNYVQDQGLHLFINNNTDKLGFDLTMRGGPTSAVTVTDGRYHVMGVTNASGTIQLHLDGLPTGSSQAMSPNIGSTYGPDIGYDAESGGFYFGGCIDWVYIWVRALSRLQIKELTINPLQIIESRRRYWVVPAMGATIPVLMNQYRQRWN